MGYVAEMFRSVFVEEEGPIMTIDRHLLARNEVVKDRATKCIHPSSICDGCVRKNYFCLIDAPKNLVALPPSKHMIFDTGHYLHKQIQKEYFKKHYGRRCVEEALVVHEGLQIRGHCDLVIDHLWGVEIKSCNAAWFKRIPVIDRSRMRCQPLYKDYFQANIYLKCLDLRHMWVLYYQKNESLRLEGKVTFNKSMWGVVEEKCSYLIKCAENEEIPPFEEQQNHSECEYHDHCFSLRNVE